MIHMSQMTLMDDLDFQDDLDYPDDLNYPDESDDSVDSDTLDAPVLKGKLLPTFLKIFLN